MECSPVMAAEVDYDRIQMIGDLGENLFERLCIRSKFNRTRPGRDSFGWDYFVEIALTSAPFVYADARQGVVTALVQVKATDRFDGAIHTITVKNHNYLAKYHMPTFVFIVDYDDGEDPIGAYLCHYDTDRIAATLKKVRELQARGKTDYHKHTMQIRPTSEETFDLANPNLLQERIAEVVGDDYGAYLQRKDTLVKTLGFEEGRHTFKFNSYTSLDGMTDALLGLRTIDIENGLFADLRFGIELGGREVKSGTLTAEPSNPVDCLVVVRDGATGDRIKVVAKAAAAAIPGMERETFKVRVFGSFFNIVITNDNISVSYKVDIDRKLSISNIVQELRFLQACGNKTTAIEVYRGKQTICTAKIDEQASEMQDINYVIYLAENIERLLIAHSAIDEVPLSIREVYQHKEMVAWGRLILERRGTDFNGEFNDINFVQLKKQPGIFYIPIVIGTEEKQLILFAHWKTLVDVSGQDVHARLSKGRVWDTMITDESTSNEEIKKLWGEFVAFCKVPQDHVTICHNLDFKKSAEVIEGEATEKIDS